MELKAAEPYALPEEIRVHVGRVRSVRRLPSKRREVLLVRADKGEFVLKVSSISQAKWLANESRALSEPALCGSGIAPRCVLGATILADKCYQLTEFLHGEPLSKELRASSRGADPDIVRQAASLLRRVHDLSIQPPDGPATLDRLLEVAEDNLRRSLLDPGEFGRDDPMQVLHWLKAERPQCDRLVFSHGDFRPKNLNTGPHRTLSLIDWEHSIWCSPYYDIAVFSYYLKPEEMDLFLDEYGIDNVEEDLLLYYEQLSLFLNV